MGTETNDKMTKRVLLLEDDFIDGIAPERNSVVEYLESDLIRRADEIVLKLLRKSDAFIKKHTHEGESLESESLFATLLHAYGNNSLIISGERGTGKTTFLEIYRNHLKDRKDFSGHTIVFMNTALPQTIKNQHAVRCVVNRITSSLRQLILRHKDSFKNPGYQVRRREIVELIELCSESVGYIEKPDLLNPGFSTLERENCAGDSTILKQNLYFLVKKYLELVGMLEGKESSVAQELADKQEEQRLPVMVMVFDDADETNEYIVPLLNQIRTFLTLPNIIVFLCANMRQITYCLRKAKTQWSDRIDFDVAKDLEKDFPVTHRVELSELEDRIRNDVSEISLVYKKDGEDLCGEFGNLSMDSQIRALLYQRTGIVLSNHNESAIHPVLENSMRGLSRFLQILFGMENLLPVLRDLRETDGQKELAVPDRTFEKKRLKNLEKLKNYYINEWCSIHLTSTEIKIVRALNGIYEGKWTGKGAESLFVDEDAMGKNTEDQPVSGFGENRSVYQWIDFLKKKEKNDPETRSRGLFVYVLDLLYSLFAREEISREKASGRNYDFSPVTESFVDALEEEPYSVLKASKKNCFQFKTRTVNVSPLAKSYLCDGSFSVLNRIAYLAKLEPAENEYGYDAYFDILASSPELLEEVIYNFYEAAFLNLKKTNFDDQFYDPKKDKNVLFTFTSSLKPLLLSLTEPLQYEPWNKLVGIPYFYFEEMDQHIMDFAAVFLGNDEYFAAFLSEYEADVSEIITVLEQNMWELFSINNADDARIAGVRENIKNCMDQSVGYLSIKGVGNKLEVPEGTKVPRLVQRLVQLEKHMTKLSDIMSGMKYVVSKMRGNIEESGKLTELFGACVDTDSGRRSGQLRIRISELSKALEQLKVEWKV